ncbi:ABC transporter substrate-binding protein [Fusicatenibacter saccharivorans]|uniref:ABC transporter substrate-binding protein n=1 Tax=Fusicatenibacter saccharivorans TaxID=1150298 RepID=UPI00156FDA5A|nr:ABC transporter substrate-binding protein [Fusicatenibacter saccharivorans]NSD23251.1 ABC transporter substrate-binding protein [Fusicatenibacter saccharivorans]NSD79740.1 ABC transporter substrate-binding protein [Fusicatenibacter saccharivorans]
MNKKKAMALLLVSVMAGSMLAGCGSDNASSSNDGSSKSADSSNQDSYTVKILAPGDASTDDCAKISEAASKITEEKFNTKVELTRVGFGSYDQQVNLTLASSEKLDLMYEYCGNVTSAISSGQIVPITDYLDSYGSDMKSQISDSDWKCVTFNGDIYGVPANKEKATGWGFAMNKEMADATGIDYSSIKTEEELEPLLEKVKEMYPDVYPIVSNNGSMSLMTDQDDLGGDIGSLESASGDNTTVINYYGTDEYMNEMKLRYDWAQKGLLMPDASTSTENANSLIGAGKGFGRFTNTKPGIEKEMEKEVGKEVVVLEMVKPYTTTTRVDIVWYVPHNSEKPERAVQVLNEIYTNPDLANLFINGLEGKHYEFVDKEKGIVNYPEGVNASNTGYTSLPWAWPNETISYIWEGLDSDIWDQIQEFNKDATVSPAKGFAWDNTEVQNEVTACANVVAKYGPALECGSLEPETTIPKFLDELKAAGADTIIAEKQKQLDAWLEANK